MQVVGDRIRRTMLTAALAGAVTAVTATPAAAGGWWTYPQLDDQALVIGETATVSADLLFASVETAEEAAGSGEYFVYLVRGIDEEGLQEAMSSSGPGGDWWTTPDWAGLLAPLTLDRDTDSFGGATATFVVPEVEPGIYDVMLCDRGCSQPLADVVPLREVYVGDAAIVQLLRDASLEARHVLDQLGDVESQLDRLQEQTGALRDDVDALDQQLDGLATADHRRTASLAALESRIGEGERQGSVRPPWWTHAGWFLAGAALAVAWMGRRHGRATQELGDDRGHAADRDGTTGSIHVDDAESSPPELVTRELDRGSPVR